MQIGISFTLSQLVHIVSHPGQKARELTCGCKHWWWQSPPHDMLDTECSPKVEPVEKQKGQKENCWLRDTLADAITANKREHMRPLGVISMKSSFFNGVQARIHSAKWSTYHGVTLGSETIQEVQHSHVQCLNCLWLENRMIEDCVNVLDLIWLQRFDETNRLSKHLKSQRSPH